MNQTLINVNGWNAWVHLPDDYDANPAQTYPTIIFFPGTGEVGADANKVIANGPGAYITQGWTGNIGNVKFIVISLQPDKIWQVESTIQTKINTLKSLYRIDPKRLHLTGLSMGGWQSTTFVTADPLGGPYTYAGQVASVVEVEGVKPDDNSPYPDKFDNFAKAGGRLLGFEQVNDSRDIKTRVDRMNLTKPGSAIFVSTNYGGGGHGSWQYFYGGSGMEPVKFMLDGVSQNVYEWMSKQSLSAAPPVVVPPVVTPPPTPPVVNPPVPPVKIAKNTDGGWYKPNLSGIVPGDIIELEGDYAYWNIEGLNGTADKKITIRNKGKNRIGTNNDYAAIFYNCSHFIIDGSNGGETEGITFGPAGGLYIPQTISLADSTDYEIKYCGVTHGQVGFFQNPLNGRDMQNIKIHHCHGYDMNNPLETPAGREEIIYYGNTSKGTLESPRHKKIEITDNLFEDLSGDGIQLANAEDFLIARNTIRRYGTAALDDQQTGIIVGGNSFNGIVEDNTIQDGGGSGIEIFASGNITVRNNKLINTGQTDNQPDAIYVNPKGELKAKLNLTLTGNLIDGYKRFGVNNDADNTNGVKGTWENNTIQSSNGRAPIESNLGETNVINGTTPPPVTPPVTPPPVTHPPVIPPVVVPPVTPPVPPVTPPPVNSKSVVVTVNNGNKFELTTQTAQKVSWRIYNAAGTSVKHGSISLSVGAVTLTVSSLTTPGTYYFMLITGSEITWTKFMK